MMRKQIKSRKPLKIALILLLSGIVPIIILQLKDINTGSSYSMLDVVKPSFATGDARSLLITQHATISKTITPGGFPVNVSYTLMDEWVSKNTSIYFNGVTHQEDYILNGDFASHLDDWDFWSNSPSELVDGGWKAGYIEFEIRNGQLYPGNHAYYNQSVVIPENFTDSKQIEFAFDYNYNPQSGSPTTNISLYYGVVGGGIEVNDTVYLTNLSTNSWTRVRLLYEPLLAGQQSPDTFEVRMGVYVHNATLLTSQQGIGFDNVELKAWTGINQPDLITVVDVDNSTNYTYNNTGSGTGECIIPTNRDFNVTRDVIFSLFYVGSGYNNFEVSNILINSSVEKSINSTSEGIPGSTYLTNGLVAWSTEWMMDTPYKYYNERLVINKPIDWNVTSILDAYDVERINSSTGAAPGSNATVLNGSILDVDGTWTLHAYSNNYIENGTVQSWNGTAFVQDNIFYVNDTFIFEIGLNNSITLINSTLNCTIYYPNSTVYIHESREPSNFTEIFGNFSVDATIPVGNYSVVMYWANSLSRSSVDQIGYKELSFQVIHTSNLTAVNAYIEGIPGQSMLVKVNFTDLDTRTPIIFGVVSYNTTYGNVGTMIYLGGGVYFTELDTTGIPFGDYYISFNASKDFYDNITTDNLVHLKLVSEPMRLEVPVGIKDAMANDHAYYEVNLTGEISGAPLSPANLSTDWIENYTINDIGNGTYGLNFSTFEVTSGAVPETFTIIIDVNKSGYGDVSNAIFLRVTPIPTQVGVNETLVSVPVGNQFAINVNYTVMSNGSLISGADLTVNWPSSHAITPSGDKFVVTFNTTNLTTGSYSVLVELSRDGFETNLEFITVIIEPKPSELILLNGSIIEVPKDQVFNITCRYLAQGVDYPNGTVNLTGDLLDQFQWNGSVYYLTIDASLLSLGSYSTQVVATDPNVITQIKSMLINVVPVPSDSDINTSIAQVALGNQFDVKVNYTISSSDSYIAGANISVTWLDYYTVTPVADGYIITLDTTDLDISTYTGLIELQHSSFETRYESFQAVIQPIPTALIISNPAPYEFIKGDLSNINLSFLANGIDFPNATINITGDLNGQFQWNGSGYNFPVDTSNLTGRSYIAQIIATGSNLESQLKEFIFTVVLVDIEINATATAVTITEGESNIIQLIVHDTIHNINRTDLVVSYSVEGWAGTLLPEANETYELDIGAIGLLPSDTPYTVEITVNNPDGDDASILVSVYVPLEEGGLDLWTIVIIVAIVAGALTVALVALSRREKLTKFQKQVRALKDELFKKGVLKGFPKITRSDTIISHLKSSISDMKDYNKYIKDGSEVKR
ncbi:MAG: hypothetical protein ACFFCS_20775 [Candidatus Hodarchaeota archaeon]